ncbi:MAG: OmpA family protein [Betaproteobacteria bacterium]|nr:OmpA family protein [Betaproteobacteria bacterium]
MSRLTTLAAAVLAAVGLSACANKSYVALLDNPDGGTGKVYVKGAKGEQVIDKAGSGAPLDGSQKAAAIPPGQIQRDFGEAMAARPTLPKRYLLYFESGGTKLTAESNALIPQIIADAKQRPGVDASIIGHTDTVGKADANTALALRRAQTVADQIKAQGLTVVALVVESHGESNLLVATPDETPEPRNRRVEISLR